MDQPRYSVKTLLAASTLVAVLVACLAPWLRQIPAISWAAVALSIGCQLGIAAAHGFLWYRKKSAARSSSDDRAVDLVVRFAPVKWTIGSILGLALLLAWANLGHGFVAAERNAIPMTQESPLEALLGCAIPGWLLSHFFIIPRLRSGLPIEFAPNEMHVPGRKPIEWQDLRNFRWIDRASGRLAMIVAPHTQWSTIDVWVQETDVEAVETYLCEKLSGRFR